MHVFLIGVINFVESIKKHPDTTESLFACVHTASCLCWKYCQITAVCRFVAYIAHTIRSTTLTNTLTCTQSVCWHPKMQIISALFLYVKKKPLLNHLQMVCVHNYTVASKLGAVLHTLNWSISSGKFSHTLERNTRSAMWLCHFIVISPSYIAMWIGGARVKPQKELGAWSE